jgi:hypothetical protein
LETDLFDGLAFGRMALDVGADELLQVCLARHVELSANASEFVPPGFGCLQGKLSHSLPG